ncbi:MAG: hypothetical protein FD138_733 [Planctomycetota bacterium]|nr:MAG: hypothetical protein FD138_733 [Planctomycetota bacterium]
MSVFTNEKRLIRSFFGKNELFEEGISRLGALSSRK